MSRGRIDRVPCLMVLDHVTPVLVLTVEDNFDYGCLVDRGTSIDAEVIGGWHLDTFEAAVAYHRARRVEAWLRADEEEDRAHDHTRRATGLRRYIKRNTP